MCTFGRPSLSILKGIQTSNVFCSVYDTNQGPCLHYLVDNSQEYKWLGEVDDWWLPGRKLTADAILGSKTVFAIDRRSSELVVVPVQLVTAISHTWGRFNTNKKTYKTDWNIDWELPVINTEVEMIETKEHLMKKLDEITKNFDTNFLWIDWISIDQRKTSRQQHDIDEQAYIYSHCERVVVWCHEISIEEVENVVLVYNNTYNMTNYQYGVQMTDIKLLNEQEIDIAWFSAAWTVQEAILARNGNGLYIPGGRFIVSMFEFICMLVVLRQDIISDKTQQKYLESPHLSKMRNVSEELQVAEASHRLYNLKTIEPLQYVFGIPTEDIRKLKNIDDFKSYLITRSHNQDEHSTLCIVQKEAYVRYCVTPNLSVSELISAAYGFRAVGKARWSSGYTVIEVYKYDFNMIVDKRVKEIYMTNGSISSNLYWFVIAESEVDLRIIGCTCNDNIMHLCCVLEVQDNEKQYGQKTTINIGLATHNFGFDYGTAIRDYTTDYEVKSVSRIRSEQADDDTAA